MTIPPWPPQDIPELPRAIKDAAADANLVVFVGAGVSAQMGCPSWREFAEAALKSLATKKLISFGDIKLLAELDARKKLSIALQIAESQAGALDFEELIIPKHTKPSKIYVHLNSIGCSYVTTNYDRFLDTRASESARPTAVDAAEKSAVQRRDLIHRPEQLTSARVAEPGTVVHLHGSLDDPAHMILTTADYLRHYNDEHVKTFLSDLFSRQTVLFVGYGLDEAEILEHILRKGSPGQESRRALFMLSGFYQHQRKIYEHLSRYYKTSFDLELVPYSMDDLDYGQLEIVIQDWAGKLEVGNPSETSRLNDLLSVIDE